MPRVVVRFGRYGEKGVRMFMGDIMKVVPNSFSIPTVIVQTGLDSDDIAHWDLNQWVVHDPSLSGPDLSRFDFFNVEAE